MNQTRSCPDYCGVSIERAQKNNASILSKVSCSLPAYITPKCHLSSKHSRCTLMCTWCAGYIWVDIDLAHFSQCEPIISFKVNANGQWHISAISEYVLNTKWIRDTACVWFTVVARIRRHSNTSICVSIGANSGHSYGIRQRLLPVITLTVHLMATMYFPLLSMTLPGAGMCQWKCGVKNVTRCWLVVKEKHEINPSFAQKIIFKDLGHFNAFAAHLQHSLSEKMAAGHFFVYFFLSLDWAGWKPS